MLRSSVRCMRTSSISRFAAANARVSGQYAYVDFNNAAAAYESKTLSELLLAIGVFQVCRIRPLVAHADRLLDLSLSVLGKSLTYDIIRRTFFGHFCAGEDAKGIQPSIARLRAAGVGAILDYAAENDADGESGQSVEGSPAVETPAAVGVDANLLQARTYFYDGEDECDRNTDITLRSIQTAAAERGFAAVKVTALGQPELLRHVSEVISNNRRLFRALAEVSHGGSVSQPYRYMQAVLTREEFVRGIKLSGMRIDTDTAERIFSQCDTSGSGTIDMIEWLDYVATSTLGAADAETPELPQVDAIPQDPAWLPLQILPDGAPTVLNAEMQARLVAMLARADRLAAAAAEAGVTLMIDAEQTYLQPAIDHVTLTIQRDYNRERGVVYNTYQAYLRDCIPRLRMAHAAAQRHGFKFGAKLVRGAYMVQERARAQRLGYEDPIQPDIQSTNASYDACVNFLLNCIAEGDGTEIMIATHNEQSVHQAVMTMAQLGIQRKEGGVSFGQLLGMCDHVSFSLGKAGYGAYKYVPYGPVHEVIPYLVRRAQENSGMLGSSGKETRMMMREVLRRVMPGK